jgi:hypothetical protein
MSQKLQEILDEASRRVQEWPEWRKSEALKVSEQSVDSGKVNSAGRETAGPGTQHNATRQDC